MFENILGQESVVSRLSEEVRSSLLPPALLFAGPDYAGKASTALELARVLTCKGPDASVPWRCACTSCTQQRHLLHPETLLLGGRYFTREIHVAVNALKRDRREPLRYLLERSVRKLTRRFDPVLWEGDTSRLGKVDPLLQQIDEALAGYLPGAPMPDDRHFSDGLDALAALATKLESAVNLNAVAVDVIRRVNRWTRISPAGPAKVALIENVDRLGDSSRNALLKTLEEPPENVYFILTTSRRGAVIATILSRARQYGFAGRGAAESAKVISRIFRDSPQEPASIRDYFLGLDGGGLRPLASRFLDHVTTHEEIELALVDEIAEVISTLGRSEGFHYFLEELADLLRERLREENLQSRVAETWRREIATARERVESYNMPASRVVEGLFYAMEAG